MDLRTQVAVLKESRVAVEEELKACSAALLQKAEETVQHRAENSSLRYSGLVYLCLLRNAESEEETKMCVCTQAIAGTDGEVSR